MVWGCEVWVSNDIGLIWSPREAMVCHTDVRGSYGLILFIFCISYEY